MRVPAYRLRQITRFAVQIVTKSVVKTTSKGQPKSIPTRTCRAEESQHPPTRNTVCLILRHLTFINVAAAMYLLAHWSSFHHHRSRSTRECWVLLRDGLNMTLSGTQGSNRSRAFGTLSKKYWYSRDPNTHQTTLRQYDYYLGTFGYIRLLHPFSTEVGISLHTTQYMYTQSLRFYKTSSLCLRTFLYARPSVTRGRHQASMVAIYLRPSSSCLSQAARRQSYRLFVASRSKHEESSWCHLRIRSCIAIIRNHHRISQPCASYTASNRI